MTGERGSRYWRNLGCFLVVVLMLAAVGLAVGIAWRHADAFLHPRRHLPVETPADRGLAYRDVAFSSADGLTLQGWYIPSQNGAAIIAGHGIGASRLLNPVEVLARQGYGVLAFDWRAHGESEGDLCTFGYHEVRDVEGALAWLQAQPDVDPARIGILGESMGAVTAIRAAAELPGIRAVVADSPYPGPGRGHRTLLGKQRLAHLSLCAADDRPGRAADGAASGSDGSPGRRRGHQPPPAPDPGGRAGSHHRARRRAALLCRRRRAQRAVV